MLNFDACRMGNSQHAGASFLAKTQQHQKFNLSKMPRVKAIRGFPVKKLPAPHETQAISTSYSLWQVFKITVKGTSVALFRNLNLNNIYFSFRKKTFGLLFKMLYLKLN